MSKASIGTRTRIHIQRFKLPKESLMRIKSIVAIALVATLAIACVQKSAETASPAVSVIVPSEIKDGAAWKAAYESLIEQYTAVVVKLNGGDVSLTAKSTELANLAAELDATAEKIKSTLAGQELADFEASMKDFKESFANAINS